MVIAIGTDLVSIPRMARALMRHSVRLARRLLSDVELEEFQHLKRGRAAFLARRFAAREAVAKALGTGIAQGVSWRDFEVRHDSKGAPQIHLHATARVIAKAAGVDCIHLSLSDEGDYALAFVVLAGDNSATTD